MKIEASYPERIEATLYASYGALEGFYKYSVKPVVEEQPLALYAIAGIIGGVVIRRLLDKHGI